MPQPTLLSFLGIAKEAVYGTAVPATTFMPVTSMKPVDKIEYLEDKGIRGSYTDMYGVVPGPALTEYEFEGDVFPDVVGFPIVGVLGDLTTTGASAPFTHAAALLNAGNGQPPSYTISDYYVNATRQFPGFVFSEFSMKMNADNLLSYSAKGMGQPSITTVKPTPSYSGQRPIAAWTGATLIGGVASAVMVEAECSIKRNLTSINTVDGTQGPRSIWGGPVMVEGKMTLVMEDDAAYLAYLNNTQPALDFSFSAGAGPLATQVKLHMSQAAYTAAEIERGKDYVEVAITFKSIANATDIGVSGGVSPIKATLQNAVPANTYK